MSIHETENIMDKSFAYEVHQRSYSDDNAFNDFLSFQNNSLVSPSHQDKKITDLFKGQMANSMHESGLKSQFE